MLENTTQKAMGQVLNSLVFPKVDSPLSRKNHSSQHASTGWDDLELLHLKRTLVLQAIDLGNLEDVHGIVDRNDEK